MELHLPSEVGLGQDGTTSTAQIWPRARQNYISCPRLASGEMEHHLLFEVGLWRHETTSPVRGWHQVRQNIVFRPWLALGKTEQRFCARKDSGGIYLS
jgi:hypothetical protein